MGSGASNVKPHSPTSVASEDEFSAEGKIKRKNGKNTPLSAKSDGQVPFKDDKAKLNGGGGMPLSVNSSVAARTRRGSIESHGVLPPIKKQSNTSSSRDPVLPMRSCTSESKLQAVNNTANSKQSDRMKLLEEELAKSESQRMDLQDQCQMLEERLKGLGQTSSTKNSEASQMNETIHAKDQYIVKLEKDLKALQVESNTTRLKLKKRIKNLTNQLHEVRQEASINQMEMKQEIAQYKEKLNEGSSSQTASTLKDTSDHSKIIVELSNQLSEQEEKISTLETSVVEKDLLIESLQSQMKKMEGQDSSNTHDIPDERPTNATGDRLHSSRGSRYQSSSNTASSVRFGTAESKTSDGTLTPLTRQSTALSDSDSDWDTSEAPSHTHSAPARVRVKSAQSIQSVSKKATIGGTLKGDDDTVMEYLKNSEPENGEGHSGSTSRARPHRKSALKNHLEKRKQESQLGSLMGPSLAFASRGNDLPSDTSCEPTPRNTDPSILPGFPRLTVVTQDQY